MMLLITPQEIISHAFSEREIISPAAFRPTKIDISQEHFVRPRIGDGLFEAMQQGEFSDFNDHFIKPALAYFVRYSMIEELSVGIGDNGTVIYSGGQVDEDLNEKSNQNSTSTTNDSENRAESVTTTQRDDIAEIITTTNNIDKKEDSVKKETTNENDTHDTTRVETTNTTETNSPGTLSKSTLKDSEVAEIFRGEVDTIKDTTDKVNILQNSVNTQDIDKDNTYTKTITNNIENSNAAQQNELVNRIIENQNIKATQNYQPASRVMVHRLQIRALSDANVLINKAVRYIKANPQIFGEFSEINSSSFYF